MSDGKILLELTWEEAKFLEIACALFIHLTEKPHEPPRLDIEGLEHYFRPAPQDPLELHAETLVGIAKLRKLREKLKAACRLEGSDKR